MSERDRYCAGFSRESPVNKLGSVDPGQPAGEWVFCTLVEPMRRCTRNSCEQRAVATLTYSYQDSTVVVGPISVYSEPHTYDLCAQHADSLVPPRGWEVLHLDREGRSAPQADDLLALADAVRRDGRGVPPSRRTHRDEAEPGSTAHEPGTLPSRDNRARLSRPESEPLVTRGHLRMLGD